MKLQGVIFDMDGVLIDSTTAGYRVRSRLLAARGVDLDQVPDPHNENHKASSTKLLLEAVYRHAGTEIDLQAFGREMITSMRDELKDARADERLVHLLDELSKHGIPCAIASSGRPEGVRFKLETLGLTNNFAQVVTADDVTHHKPHPEAYLLAAERLGVESKNCVVIEDTAAGVAAGEAAGCVVVGFSRFKDDKRPIEGTALTVDNWSELSYSRLARLLS